MPRAATSESEETNDYQSAFRYGGTQSQFRKGFIAKGQKVPVLYQGTTNFITHSRSLSVLLAVVIGLFGAYLVYGEHSFSVPHTDFRVSWFGAKSALHGIDPYPLVGKGKSFDHGWPLTYPATSFVAILPLGLLPERLAAMVFVFVSTFVLAFGILRKAPYLLPLFLTESYMNAARLGQWNILLTGILFFPALALFSAVKPQSALPQLMTRKDVWPWAILGGIALLFVSLFMIPSWPQEWIAIIKTMPDSRPPVMRFGGFLLLLALIRWKDPKARLLLGLALIPQTMSWYSALPLFTIPRDWRQSIALATVSILGGYVSVLLAPDTMTDEGFHRYFGMIFNLTMYLPALVLILLPRLAVVSDVPVERSLNSTR